MRFTLTDDQAALRDAVRDLLAKECPPAAVRAAWTDDAADRAPWEALAAMGVLDLLVPEADGGFGLDETFLAPILEECGRAALPHPVVETAMVAAPLLGAGAGMVSTDLGGPHVPWAADADLLLLLDGPSLRQVSPTDLAIDPIETVDRARRVAAVHLADNRGEVVTDDPAAIERARDRGTLGSAAFLVGLGQAMLDLTVAYVKEREQFGKPVGSFQAVKHHLADAALALEFARPAVWQAAWAAAHDEPTRARDVSTAKVLASDAAELTGRKALQCHGAIGYTVEADLHLYLKRTWALARAWGDTTHHTDRVAAALGAVTP